MNEYKIIIKHDWYGCETGCCGTRAIFFFNDKEIASKFTFDHFDSKEEAQEYFNELAEKTNRLKEWKNATHIFDDLKCN